jgi:orotate phosphoribosyltransferase
MDEQQPQQMVPYTKIRYVGIGQLTVYFVSEDELRMLESGEPSSVYLNLAIAFLSIGASFFISLLLSEPQSIYKFTVIVVLTVGTVIAGIVLLVLWLRSSKNASNVIKQIRARGISTSQEVMVKGPNNP